MVLISGKAGIGKSRIVATLSESPPWGAHRRVRYQNVRPTTPTARFIPWSRSRSSAAGIRSHDMPGQMLDKLEAMLALRTQQVARATPLIAALLFDSNRRPLSAAWFEPGAAAATDICLASRSARGVGARATLLVICERYALSRRHYTRTVRSRGRSDQGTADAHAWATVRPEFESSWLGFANVSLLHLDRPRPAGARARWSSR